MSAVADWVVPTGRATSWRAFGGVFGCLLLTWAVAELAGTWPSFLLGIGAAALAAAVTAGLGDPAASLLAAVPTSAACRRAQRLMLLVPSAAGIWLLFLASGQVSSSPVEPGWPFGPLFALTATGLAVAVWAPDHMRVEIGAAAPLLWYAAAWALAGDGWAAQNLLPAWEQHPWLVTAAAALAFALGRNR